MKIILDAMGGDNAPLAIVQGALAGPCRSCGADIVLVGREEAIRACLTAAKTLPEGVEIVNATEVVDMCDDPATAFKRKKDSSMTVGLTMLKDGEGDAFVSAGSTGALLAGATLLVKRIRGIRRAAMGPGNPHRHGPRRAHATAAPTPSVRRNICCNSRIWAAFTPSGSWGWRSPGWAC